MARRQATDAALITSAKKSRSLDADERNRRYLITITFRVIAFVSGSFAPAPWNWVLYGAAAFLPVMAVLLANAIDKRSPPGVPDDDDAPRRPALTGGDIVPGHVEDGA